MSKGVKVYVGNVHRTISTERWAAKTHRVYIDLGFTRKHLVKRIQIPLYHNAGSGKAS